MMSERRNYTPYHVVKDILDRRYAERKDKIIQQKQSKLFNKQTR